MTTRLNYRIRNALNKLVREVVTSPETEAAAEAAYETARPLVVDVLTSRWPAVDMECLKRYGFARRSNEGYYLDLTSDVGFTQFKFKCDDSEAPYVPDNSEPTGCSGEVYAAVRAWRDANDIHRTALEALQNNYFALINGATTLEEVEAVWPGADAVRRTVRGVPAVQGVGEEIIRRVMEDVRKRAEAAK